MLQENKQTNTIDLAPVARDYAPANFIRMPDWEVLSRPVMRPPT